MNLYLLKTKTNLFTLFFLYMVVFSPSLMIHGHYVVFSQIFLWIVALSIIVYVLISGHIKDYNTNILLIFLSLVLLLIYLLINYLFYSDIYLVVTACYLVLLYFVCSQIPHVFTSKFLFDIFFLLTVFDASIVLLMAFCEPFRMFVQSYQREILLLKVSGNIRMVALNGLAGSVLSVLYFAGAVSSFYMENKNRVFQLLGLSIIIIAFFYTGRTGLIFFFIYLYFRFIIACQKKYIPARILLAILFPLAGYFLLLHYYHLIYDLPREFKNSLRFILVFFDPNIDSWTLPSLMNSIPVLLHLKNPLFGDYGFQHYNLSSLHSDIGYVKILFSSGIVGQLLFALPYFLILLVAFFYRKKEKSFNFVIILLVFTIFIFHLKGFYMGEQKLSFIIFLFFFHVYHRYSSRYARIQGKL